MHLQNNEQILSHIIFIHNKKKAFQNLAQAALDASAIDQSTDLCPVSAKSVEHYISNNLVKPSPSQLYWLLTLRITHVKLQANSILEWKIQ